MPYSVEQLIQDRPKPVTVASSAPVTEALRLMVEHDYSQLPVVEEDQKPRRMITYEAIIRGVRNFKANIDDLYVRDVMVAASSFNKEDNLFDLLEKLKVTNAVLIVDNVSNLVGIVTGYDSTEYFRNRAEDMMRVEDIEVMIKDFISAAYTLDNGEIDQAQLASAVAKCAHPENENGQGKSKGFDDLTLNDYINLLLHQKTWYFFEPIFKKSNKHIRGLLNDVRITRNALAHFRNDISPDQADQLLFCSEWLERCKIEYERTVQQKSMSQAQEQSTTQLESAQTDENITTLGRSESIALELIAEETSPTDSRYAPLTDWLANRPSSVDQVDLAFADVENIIGGELPASARNHPAWWGNDSSSPNRQSQAWLDIGWRRNRLNMTQEIVSFTRIREREKSYIDFFSTVRAKLRKKADFEIRGSSADGTNWNTWQVLTGAIPSPGMFTMSFTRGQRFRVECYIDTGDQRSTKQIFDRIFAQKETLEAQLGAINWERIDNKRASRVAVYHDGKITDDAATLEKLQAWAVDKAIGFYHYVRPSAEQAVKEVLNS